MPPCILPTVVRAPLQLFALAALVALAQCIGVAPFEAGEAEDTVAADTAAPDTGALDTVEADTAEPPDTVAPDAAVVDTEDAEDAEDAADGDDAADTEVVTCAPSCPGACGPDGCGGTCGECEGELACSPEHACLAPHLIVGNQCESPVPIDTLPYATTGDTRFGSDAFTTSGLSCPGIATPGAVGGGFRDQVYRFLPTATGTWVIRVKPEFDASLTILGSCVTGATLTACERGADDGGVGEEEVVAVRLTGGVAVWVVVDGGALASDGGGEGPYDLEIDGPCFPDCSGRVCGDDGCAGSCGECDSGTVCGDAGLCVTPPGDRCEAPFVIDGAALPFAWEGTTATADANPSFATSLDCSAGGFVVGQASPDQVFALTPVVDGVYTVHLDADFDAVVSVREGCDADAATCLAVEAQVEGDETLLVPLDAGVDYVIVVDGFGNDVAERGAYTLSVDAPCPRTCGDRVCGEDGCGLTCGECPNAACAPVGTCVAPQTLPGNLCQTAFVVGPVPFAGAGNTLYASDALSLPESACGDGYPTLGAGTPDQVWRFAAPAAGIYRVDLDASFYGALYVLASCATGETPDDDCLAAAAGAPHVGVNLDLAAGQEVRVVVDGASPTVTPLRGTYALRVSGVCAPQCEGRDCGLDGCGGSCGTCQDGLACNAADGRCVAASEVVGNRCENPLKITSVPAHRAGTTLGRTPDYSVPAGACPGIVGAWGAASGDTVYAFTPPAPGSYAVSLDADFDSLLYVVRDCGAVATSCLGGVDALGVGPETLTLTLTDVSTVFVIVDGFSNFGDVSGTFELVIEAL
ncbi:MAG: hypothetical protein CVU56_23200 [Deltaproteobacteria bacterium HGW-Deltaproteobacteria-14]|nr:MAG: hypothetical protein CVU56_23200 [Deltaproteobacteria bacterium HGW-Deltaproteobacteria-14]